MDELLKDIDELNDYSFKIYVTNPSKIISLSDDEQANADDFLRMLENGSPLHDIVASRPIERTWLTVKDKCIVTYNECVDSILSNKKNDVMLKMIDLANFITNIANQYVDSKLRNNIACHVYYKDRKIN